MDKRIIKKAVCALATGFLIKLLLLQVAAACPSPLQCVNFTAPDKINDCNYITSEPLSYGDQQDALCILWDQEYDFPLYQNPVYSQAQANFAFVYSEIDTSRFILLFKIVIFLMFNYALFSVLTKPSFMQKCLRVG